MKIGDKIRNARINKDMSQEELGARLGVKKAAVSKWENGTVSNIKRSVLRQLADILELDPAELIMEAPKRSGEAVRINVLGRVAAGIPIEAIEDIIDTEEITAAMAATGTFIGLRIAGDSMEPRIMDGDTVIVRLQDDADSGDTVIALVDGHDATCKRLRKYKEGIELIANNPKYAPQYYDQGEVDTLPVKIIGKVVELRGKF